MLCQGARAGSTDHSEKSGSKGEIYIDMVASQMAPYSLFSALLLTRAHMALVKKSALNRALFGKQPEM